MDGKRRVPVDLVKVGADDIENFARSFRAPLRSSQAQIFDKRWETTFSRFVQICETVLMISYKFSISTQLQPIEKTEKPSHDFVQRDNRRLSRIDLRPETQEVQ